MYKYISNQEQDTMELAKKLASKLNIGDIVLLSGDLGSGKTKFVEGFLSFFGLAHEISSPTFTIVNEHLAHLSGNPLSIYHFDVYRLADIDEFYSIGRRRIF